MCVPNLVAGGAVNVAHRVAQECDLRVELAAVGQLARVHLSGLQKLPDVQGVEPLSLIHGPFVEGLRVLGNVEWGNAGGFQLLNEAGGKK